jgi:hypothetical protein
MYNGYVEEELYLIQENEVVQQAYAMLEASDSCYLVAYFYGNETPQKLSLRGLVNWLSYCCNRAGRR